jgi:hypothetical protein
MVQLFTTDPHSLMPGSPPRPESVTIDRVRGAYDHARFSRGDGSHELDRGRGDEQEQDHHRHRQTLGGMLHLFLRPGLAAFVLPQICRTDWSCHFGFVGIARVFLVQHLRHAAPGIKPQVVDLIGAPGEIRTPNPQIRSLVLYPVELRALTREKVLASF